MVNENMEFEAIVRQWLDNVRLRVKESSYVKYNNLVRNHIIYYYRLLHERQAGQVQCFHSVSLWNTSPQSRQVTTPFFVRRPTDSITLV